MLTFDIWKLLRDWRVDLSEYVTSGTYLNYMPKSIRNIVDGFIKSWDYRLQWRYILRNNTNEPISIPPASQSTPPVSELTPKLANELIPELIPSAKKKLEERIEKLKTKNESLNEEIEKLNSHIKMVEDQIKCNEKTKVEAVDKAEEVLPKYIKLKEENKLLKVDHEDLKKEYLILKNNYDYIIENPDSILPKDKSPTVDTTEQTITTTKHANQYSTIDPTKTIISNNDQTINDDSATEFIPYSGEQVSVAKEYYENLKIDVESYREKYVATRDELAELKEKTKHIASTYSEEDLEYIHNMPVFKKIVDNYKKGKNILKDFEMDWKNLLDGTTDYDIAKNLLTPSPDPTEPDRIELKDIKLMVIDRWMQCKHACMEAGLPWAPDIDLVVPDATITR